MREVEKSVGEEASLLQRAAGGDRAAFMELYDRFSGRMLGIILTVVRDRATAEDVLQDVMLELWNRSAARFDPSLGSASSWVLRIARARAIDHLRRSGRASAHEARRAEGLPRVEAREQPNYTDHSESFHAALREMPEDERVPLVLAYGYGLSREEISSHVGAPVGTIKTRLRRAVARLRGLVVESGEGALSA